MPGLRIVLRAQGVQGQEAHRHARRLYPHDAAGHQHRAALVAGLGQSVVVCVFRPLSEGQVRRASFLPLL